MNRNMIWFGRYEGWLRYLAKGVKYRDAECIRKSAALFDLMLPDHCVVVPMPSHMGLAGCMLEVANALPQGKRFIMDSLESEPHESSQSQKKAGFAPTPFRMKFDPAALERCPQADFNGGIYVIDNVLCTGVTATAAIKAIQDCSGLDAKVVTLAYATWR